MIDVVHIRLQPLSVMLLVSLISAVYIAPLRDTNITVGEHKSSD